MIARLLTAALALLTIGQSCCAVEFLTGAGGFLADQHGGRLFTLSSSHSVIVSSSWASGIDLSIIAEVRDDNAGIDVTGFANVAGSTIAQTQIQTVDSTGAVKTIKTCVGARCDVTILKSTMRPGANDVWLLATTASGIKYGATTKMSPPP